MPWDFTEMPVESILTTPKSSKVKQSHKEQGASKFLESKLALVVRNHAISDSNGLKKLLATGYHVHTLSDTAVDARQLLEAMS